jgi:hypothetical protein
LEDGIQRRKYLGATKSQLRGITSGLCQPVEQARIFLGDVSREIGDLYVGRAQNVYNTPHNKKKLSRDFIESVLRSGLKQQ